MRLALDLHGALHRLLGEPRAVRSARTVLAAKKGEKIIDYILRHIDEGRIFVGCEGEELSIAEAVRITGNKPYVFSTDYPHEVDAETCKHELEELRENTALTAADKDAILFGNSQRFYQLASLTIGSSLSTQLKDLQPEIPFEADR